LRDVWQRETRHLSSVDEITSHWAYRMIVGLGPAVVPLIIDDLSKGPDDWFEALEEITGENPVPLWSRGSRGAMAHAWVKWARRKGIRESQPIASRT
jgi:hypothetical protein